MGFIGVGNRGSQLLKIFMDQPDCQIAALCDVYEPYVTRDRSKVDPRYLQDRPLQIPPMLLDKEGKRMQDANYNGTIYASEYEEKNLIADRLYGYNLDLGIDYHLSAVFVPFITIGYTSSTGANSKPASYNKSEPLISKFKTLNINVGLYF